MGRKYKNTGNWICTQSISIFNAQKHQSRTDACLEQVELDTKKYLDRTCDRLCIHTFLAKSRAKINSESDTSFYADLKQKFRPIKIRIEQEQFPF